MISGNLVRDPEQRQLPSGKPVCNFTIASNRKWRNDHGEDQEDVCYIDCKAFGRMAENISRYFNKGRPILIEGTLKHDRWQDEYGNTRSKHSIALSRFEFIGCREDNGGNGYETDNDT